MSIVYNYIAYSRDFLIGGCHFFAVGSSSTNEHQRLNLVAYFLTAENEGPISLWTFTNSGLCLCVCLRHTKHKEQPCKENFSSSQGEIWLPFLYFCVCQYHRTKINMDRNAVSVLRWKHFTLPFYRLVHQWESYLNVNMDFFKVHCLKIDLKH